MQSSWHSTRGWGRAWGQAQVGSTGGAVGSQQGREPLPLSPCNQTLSCEMPGLQQAGSLLWKNVPGSSPWSHACSKESLITLLPATYPGMVLLPPHCRRTFQIPSSPCLSEPSISQKKFLRSQKILPLCSQNIIIFSFLIKSHSPSALHTCFG